MQTCSKERPWGLHAPVRNDSDCPRCGWTAPGPLGDVRQETGSRATALGWTLHEGGAGEALAA